MNHTPNGEYFIKRPIVIKCEECGLVSTPKFQMELQKDKVDEYMYSDGCLTLCDECMNKGWTSDPKEVYDAIRNDPKLSKIVDVQSPYFK